MEKRKPNTKGTTLAVFRFLLMTGILALIYSFTISAIPDGVTTQIIGNTTKTGTAGGLANFSGNDTTQPERAGGFIFTMNLSGKTQNVRWKAFIGNVSGKLTLDDATGATIYDWSLSTLTGEVYSTRASTTINWSGIGCASLNATEYENRILNQSSKDDNISATFSSYNNDAITVSTVTVPANACRTTNMYLNATGNSLDTFEEVVLHDQNATAFNFSGAGDSNLPGSIIYAQTLEAGTRGYNNQSLYNFQLIVPERGESNWASSTPYYFYIELS